MPKLVTAEWIDYAQYLSGIRPTRLPVRGDTARREEHVDAAVPQEGL
jgi:hypothetical protein